MFDYLNSIYFCFLHAHISSSFIFINMSVGKNFDKRILNMPNAVCLSFCKSCTKQLYKTFSFFLVKLKYANCFHHALNWENNLSLVTIFSFTHGMSKLQHSHASQLLHSWDRRKENLERWILIEIFYFGKPFFSYEWMIKMAIFFICIFWWACRWLHAEWHTGAIAWLVSHKNNRGCGTFKLTKKN